MNTLSKAFLATTAVTLIVAGGTLIALGLYERQPAGIALGVAFAIGAFLVSP
jgi:hypothetical protein